MRWRHVVTLTQLDTVTGDGMVATAGDTGAGHLVVDAVIHRDSDRAGGGGGAGDILGGWGERRGQRGYVGVAGGKRVNAAAGAGAVHEGALQQVHWSCSRGGASSILKYSV